MQYEYLNYEINERIAMVTINRPKKLNCLNQTLWKEIVQAFEEGDENPKVDVHIITGAGRAFCAGSDVEEGPTLFGG